MSTVVASRAAVINAPPERVALLRKMYAEELANLDRIAVSAIH